MPGNDAEELAKIPVLFQHFQEHNQIGDAGDFLVFIKNHYSQKQTSSEHQELPFMKHLQPCLVFVIPDFSFLPAPGILTIPSSERSFPEIHPELLSAFLEAWQPPRIA